jgi:putative methyltransferase (TIGR04325 family)
MPRPSSTSAKKTGEGLKRALKPMVPPIFWELGRLVIGLAARQQPVCGVAAATPKLVYVPQGWDEPTDAVTGWNTSGVVETEKAKWDAFCRNVSGSGPLGFSHESREMSSVRNVVHHNTHISFAFVLALVAHRRDHVSVLDWGGALGHYYVIARALMPDVRIEYHCQDVPLMAEAGRALNPEVTWYGDDSCLDRTYDLVMVNGSLQYMRDWRAFLPKACAAVGRGGYFLLTRVPVVEGAPFVAIQRCYGGAMFHQQFNRTEVMDLVDSSGLEMVREIVVGERPSIANAPEQCEQRGWLFRNNRA